MDSSNTNSEWRCRPQMGWGSYDFEIEIRIVMIDGLRDRQIEHADSKSST